MRPIKGLILAAGLGSRLAPLTDDFPKPLFPVLNRPIISYAIERFRSAGVTDIAINIHHRADEIIEYLGDGSQLGVQITWYREPELLGTGGILRYCADFWRDSTLLVTASDMLTTLDLTDLIQFHRSHGGDATVATFEHGWPLHEFGGDVAVVEEGGSRIVEYQPKPWAAARSRYGATGTWVFEPSVVTEMPEGGYFDLNEDFLPLFAKSGRFHAYVGDFEFDDFGQGHGYVGGTALALDGKLGVRPAEPEIAEGIFVAPSARISPLAKLVGPVVIGPGTEVQDGCAIYGPTVIGGGCLIQEGATIRESVLLPGVVITPGFTLARALVGDAHRTVPAIREHHLP